MGINKYQDLAYLLKCKSIKNDKDTYEKSKMLCHFQSYKRSTRETKDTLQKHKL